MSARDRQLAERLHMLRHNESAVHLMLSKLITQNGPNDLVAVILDTRDEMGRDLADHLGVAGQAEEIAGPHRIPTIIGAVGRLDAARAFSETHPKIAAGLSVTPPPGHVPVIVIASGGITMAYVERISMPIAGEA